MKVDIFNTKKRYNIIYADPPWQYKDRGCNGACERHYSTMKLEDIKKLPVPKIADENCVLFLWATYPQLPEALELIKAWGFQYKTIGFQWVKKTRNGSKWFFGLGHWTRSNTEPCLIAIKGNPKPINHSISQLIIDNVRFHSQKPEIVRETIVKLMGDCKKIELFAREQPGGWDFWGDEC